MLKGTVENKQQHVDIFEAMDGRRFTRADVEDASRPGYLRPELIPIEPTVWSAAQFFNLLTPSGRPMKYVETPPDPREPRSDEAPVELRQAVEKARAILEGVRKRIQAAVDERGEAQIEQRQAAARQNAAAYNQALHREQEAMARQTDLGPEDVAAVKHYADALDKVRKWIWDERLRRYERAKV